MVSQLQLQMFLRAEYSSITIEVYGIITGFFYRVIFVPQFVLSKTDSKRTENGLSPFSVRFRIASVIVCFIHPRDRCGSLVITQVEFMMRCGRSIVESIADMFPDTFQSEMNFINIFPILY